MDSARIVKGFTLVELLFVAAILAFLIVGIFDVLTTGQNAWYTSDVAVQLQQDLRNGMMRLTRELHESGFQCNNPPDCTSRTIQVTILSDAGPNNTDILQFKVPVDYNQDGYIKNNNGIVECWGVNLSWGCLDYNCQRPLSPEPQNSNYQIEYSVDSNGDLLRRVMNVGVGAMRTDIFAHNIQNFQVTLNGNLVNIDLTASRRSILGRLFTANLSAQVMFRNGG